MNLMLELTEEEAAQLTACAQARGASPESLVRQAIASMLKTRGNDTELRVRRRLNLPLMTGAVIGSLSRRDIYDDRG